MKHLITILTIIFVVGIIPGVILGQEASEEGESEGEEAPAAAEGQAPVTDGEGDRIQTGYIYEFENKDSDVKSSGTTTEEITQESEGTEFFLKWIKGDFLLEGRVTQESLKQETLQTQLETRQSTHLVFVTDKLGDWLWEIANASDKRTIDFTIINSSEFEVNSEVDIPYLLGLGYVWETWKIIAKHGERTEVLKFVFTGQSLADETYETGFDVYEFQRTPEDRKGLYFALKIQETSIPEVKGSQVNMAATTESLLEYTLGYGFTEDEGISFTKTAYRVNKEFIGLLSTETERESTTVEANLDEQWKVGFTETEILEEIKFTPQPDVSSISSTKANTLGIRLTYTIKN